MMTIRVEPKKLAILKNSAYIRHQQGFTLIEVMVALAILATVAVIASQASGTYLRSVDNLKTRTLAHFVAQNTAANLQINAQWPQSPQVSMVSEQGRTWQVSVVPIGVEEVFGAGSSNQSFGSLAETIKPLSIQVAPVNSQTNEVQHAIADVTILLSKPTELNEASSVQLNGLNGPSG